MPLVAVVVAAAEPLRSEEMPEGAGMETTAEAEAEVRDTAAEVVEAGMETKIKASEEAAEAEAKLHS